ncbi:uncharacterized protein [Epargyreus clarus]|uniref:uncharacterized protein n=1 Tax=Epargyreus clarus TaxID=520877 RepID=UPI003C2B6659
MDSFQKVYKTVFVDESQIEEELAKVCEEIEIDNELIDICRQVESAIINQSSQHDKESLQTSCLLENPTNQPQQIGGAMKRSSYDIDSPKAKRIKVIEGASTSSDINLTDNGKVMCDVCQRLKMPKIVLHYFTFKGLGEGARMLLTYGGQEFEDHRIKRDTEWDAIKPTTPFGQVPILEIDGKKYAQSLAICRYLGRKFGLAGDSMEDEMEIDQNMDFFKEIWSKGDAIFYEADPEVRAKLQADHEKNFYPRMWQKLDDIIAKNNGHMALGKLTWGDFLFAGMHDNNKRICMIPDLYEKYPNLKRVYENVAAIPKVKAYIDASPKNDFSGKMPKIVLHNYTFKGLGEGPRMLLIYFGQEYEERRLRADVDWDNIRPTFRQAPILEVDGKRYVQPLAICRYLARKYGLRGDSMEDEMEIDQNMDFFREIYSKAEDVFYETDPELRAKLQADLEADFYPRMWQKLDETIAKNNGHMALGRLTWGDFVFAGMYDYNKRICMIPDLYEKYPNLKRVYEKVAAIPKIKTYLNTSPKNDFKSML